MRRAVTVAASRRSCASSTGVARALRHAVPV